MKVEFLHTRLPLRARFVIAFLFFAFAALIQALLERGGILPNGLFIRFVWFGLLFISLWLLKVRNFTNKPAAASVPKKTGTKKAAPKEEGIWKPVTMTDLNRMRARIAAANKAKIPGIYTGAVGGLVTALCIIPFIIFWYNFEGPGFFLIFYFYLIFIPFLWYAGIKKWIPGISGKIGVLAPVLDAEMAEGIRRRFRFSPMLFFTGEGADQMPSDIRLMLAPGDGAPQELRDELLGVQFQITYNKGEHGTVPYVYAVFITKGQGKTWQSLKGISYPRWITEPGSSTEGEPSAEPAGAASEKRGSPPATVYGTVVLRQNTNSRSDGYHTKESDVRELVDNVIKALEKV